MIDVAIVGGGPAGLAAALVLARSRKSVIVFDGGTPRNQRAVYIGGFITQDRIAPAAFRAAAHDDLRAYPTVDLRLNTIVERVDRAGEGLVVHAGGVDFPARRLLLCTGVIDEPLSLEGSRDLWGRSLFECPYCHAYEVRGKRLGFIAPHEDDAEWVMLLRAWSSNVVLFTNGAFPCPSSTSKKLSEAGIPIEERRIAGLSRSGEQLLAVSVESGTGPVDVPCEALFFRPRQRQVPVVAQLGLALDDTGFVRVDEQHRTSHPKIYAAGDLATHYHGALAAADAGSQAAHCINHELTIELVQRGQL